MKPNSGTVTIRSWAWSICSEFLKREGQSRLCDVHRFAPDEHRGKLKSALGRSRHRSWQMPHWSDSGTHSEPECHLPPVLLVPESGCPPSNPFRTLRIGQPVAIEVGLPPARD